MSIKNNIKDSNLDSEVFQVVYNGYQPLQKDCNILDNPPNSGSGVINTDSNSNSIKVNEIEEELKYYKDKLIELEAVNKKLKNENSELLLQLQILDEWGVDNWSYYGDAMHQYWDELEKNKNN